MKTYELRRDGDGPKVTVEQFGRRRPLRHVVFHSPTGFEWGYGGSGPADLALSILTDFFGEHPGKRQLLSGRTRGWRLHQAFKWDIIGQVPPAGINLTQARISTWVLAQRELSKEIAS